MKSKIRVLHIDDNLHDRQLVKDALMSESNKFEIIEADNKEKFIEHLDEKDIDIILSDFNILGFDGLQVLQLVKEKNPDMPVIIVTGTGSEEVAIEAMKMGAADYVIKSINHIRGLAHSIDLVLQNKKNKKERQRARKALLKSEEKYRKIFENVQDVFYQTNNQGIITEISPSVFKVSGFRREELIGIPASQIYYDPEERNTLVAILTSQQEVWDYEIRMNTKEGVMKYASLNAHLIFNNKNEPIGIEGSLRDITDRKLVETELISAKEKAEESDRLKTAFLHNISHEIRTPMNSIVGFSELINEPDLDSDSRQEYTNIIVASSNHLLSIITDLVTIATIESGQEKISEKSINLNSVLKQIYNQFTPLATKRNVNLKLQSGIPDQEANILTDETKLIQIISNLIGNALKFAKDGQVIFGCEIDHEQQILKFAVEDSGIGIPKNMQKEIFQRFRQVESATTRSFGGSGLGLSISKAYVELMGGKIWLESEMGKGSTFYFTIPFKSHQL